ncbi:MAG: TolC family protein, partial [Verrucomicrobiales bacterium]|jgi:multidrug efflux system outer membrane protein|nr:TolC family protein [Verrucomicrobiales bacterium]
VARYESGIDNYLGVLTAQQDLYQAQQDLIIARYYRLTNQTALYKALGGGMRE